MAHRTRTALGIDVTERSVSVALVEKHRHGYRLLAGGMVALPAAGATEASSIGTRDVSRLISRIHRHVRRRRVPAVMAISPSPVVLQLLDLPKPLPANLREFVQRELKQYVPLSGREIISDFQGIGTGRSQDRRLLAVATAKAAVLDSVGLCGKNRDLIQAVEPSVLSCARAQAASVAAGHTGDGALVAVFDARELLIAVFCRGSVDFCRVRTLPPGTIGPEMLCGWLTHELRAVTRYYELEGAAVYEGWHGWLVLRETGKVCEPVKSLTAADIGVRSLTVVDPGQVPIEVHGTPEEGFAASVAAVGAAMRLLLPDGEETRVNLLPAEVTQARQTSRSTLLAANAAVLVFLAMFVSSQFLTHVTGAMDDRITQTKVREQIHASPALVAQEKYFDAELTRLEQQLAGLRMVLTRDQTDWPAVLALIGRAAPTGVSIAQVVSGDDHRVVIQGYTLSCDAAQAFAQQLELGGPFASASLSRIHRRGQDDDAMEYQLECVLKGRK